MPTDVFDFLDSIFKENDCDFIGFANRLLELISMYDYKVGYETDPNYYRVAKFLELSNEQQNEAVLEVLQVHKEAVDYFKRFSKEAVK